MTHSTLRFLVSLLVCLLVVCPRSADAQTALLSVSPLGLPDGRLDAELQACNSSDGYFFQGCHVRLGLRVSSATVRTRPEVLDAAPQTVRYQDLDVFMRLGSRSTPDGWGFGVRTGLTTAPNQAYLGLGFDVDRHWLLGSRLIVGGGVGVKGVFGADDDLRLDAIPVMRLSAGFAF